MFRPFFRLIPKPFFKSTFISSFPTQPKTCFSDYKPENSQASESLKENLSEFGLRKCLNKMYKIKILGLAGTFGVSWLMTVTTDLAFSHPLACFLFGALGSLACLTYFNEVKSCQNEIHTDWKGRQYLTSKNSRSKLASFSGFAAFNGIWIYSLSDAFFNVSLIKPVFVIPLLMGISTCIVGGASLCTYFAKNSPYFYLCGPVLGALIAIAGMHLVSYAGISMFGHMMTNITMGCSEPIFYIWTVNFTLYTICDTVIVIDEYLKGKADHLGGSIHCFCDWEKMLRMIKQEDVKYIICFYMGAWFGFVFCSIMKE